MPPRRIVVSLQSISKEIVKRYTRSVQRNLRNSNEKQNLCNGLRYLAWAYCIFFFQGNSQDLFAGSGIRRHASYIINARRGAEGHTKRTTMGLISLLQNIRKEKDIKEKQRLYADLLQMAFADGELSEDENKLINAICSTVGSDVFYTQLGNELHQDDITMEELLMCSANGIESATSWLQKLPKEWENVPYPKSEEKRYRYLLLIISMMIADGESTEEEIRVLHQIANRMGFDHTHVYQCILYLAKRNDTDMKKASGLLSYFENANPIIDQI